MEEYLSMHNNLMNDIKNILQEHNITCEKFFLSNDEDHQSAHKKILNTLTKYINTVSDKSELEIINRKKSLDYYNKLGNEKINDSYDYQICKIIKEYLLDFYGALYKIIDGKVVYTNQENFQLPVLDIKIMEDMDSNYKYIKQKCGNTYHNPNSTICLIILKDGTTYIAPLDHQILAYWLNLNGIDINQSIRLETSKQFFDFTFSSLHNYKFSEFSNDNELIKISNDQANVIGTLYQTLKYAWRWLKPLEPQLLKCDGFGFAINDYDPILSVTNINKLEDYSGGLLDGKEYLKDLKMRQPKTQSPIHTQNVNTSNLNPIDNDFNKK